MLGIWRYLWKFTPPAAGFHGLGAAKRLRVVRRCKRWARVVVKYKQVIVQSEEGPVVRRVPEEWGLRCLEWEYVTIKDPKPGQRIPYDIQSSVPPEIYEASGKPKTRFIMEEKEAVEPKRPFGKPRTVEVIKKKPGIDDWSW